jgi:pilus assembly protein CpaB
MAANGSKLRVVAAARDLNVGERLTEADLRMLTFNGGELPAGAIQNMADAVGRGVIVPMAANEFVMNSKLAEPGTGAGLPSMIPQGMRAVSVKVNDVVAVAGFVVPGTRVDVLLTGNPGGAGGTATTTVLQNVPVLAAGQKLQRDAEGQPQNVPVITLLVSPDDAQRLTLASSEGRIQLALRNPTDVNTKAPTSVFNASLFGQSVQAKPIVKVIAKAQPIPKPAASYDVEIIRGDKRDVTKF